MNYFKTGDRVQMKFFSILGVQYDFDNETGIVVGYGTLQSGIPCLIVSMDNKDTNGIRHEHLVVPMDYAEPM